MTLLEVLEPMFREEARGKGAGVIRLWTRLMSEDYSQGEYWLSMPTFYINIRKIFLVKHGN